MRDWKVAVNRVPNRLKDPDIAAIKYLSEYAGYITDDKERVYIVDVGDAFREAERRNQATATERTNDHED